MAKYQLVLAKPKSETVPIARSGHRCATDGVFLYSYGGFNPDTMKKLFNQYIWCFHLSTKTWHGLLTEGGDFGAFPQRVASSVMLLHRRMFVHFGGTGYPFGMTNSDVLFVCDPLAQKWQCYHFPKRNVPTSGYGQGAVIGPDNCMYVFGGTTGHVYNNNLHKLNLEQHQWERIECRQSPSARYRHEMVGIEGGFIVIGGYGANGACSLDKLPMFNYEKCSWTEVQCKQDYDHGFPGPRRAHSCVKYKNNAYVCGGFDEAEDSTPGTIFDDIWKLDVETFSWSKIPQVLPHPTFFHSAAVTSEGCMYIFGGIEKVDEGQERTNNVLKMWLVIPSLERMCWDTLCDAIPENFKLNTNKLAELGTPKYLLTSYKAQFEVGLNL